MLYGAPGKGLYAFEGSGPISKLRKYFGGGLDARYTVEFQIPESAAGAFHAPPITGPLNIIRRLAGVRVAPGSVDLATGRFTACAGGRYAWLTQTTERYVVAADLGADAAVGLGIYIATSDDK